VVCARPQPRRNRFSWKIPAANEGCEKKRLKEGIARKGRFMPMKRLLLLSFLLLVIFAQNVSAIPTGSKTPVWSETPTFFNFDNSPIAEIDCNVWKYDLGPYLYTYQIMNTSNTHLSYFMLEILDTTEVESVNYDLDELDWVAPDIWAVNASGQSINALFNTNVLDIGEVSALLWYLSDYEPIWGAGTLVGTPVSQVFATADLPTPIPEPATLLLLGTGGLVAVIRKRRSG
jgi:hypothetical protein